MTELRLSSLAGLVAGMSLATIAFYEPLPLWLPLPLALMGWWRLRPAWRGAPVPRVPRAAKLTVLLVLIGALWLTGRIGVGLDGAGPLFIVLLWSKLLELHTERDFHRTGAIALFLVAAQLLLSQALGQVLFALASSLALLSVLVHLHIVGDDASGYADRRPWRTWMRSLKTASVLGLQALPFAVVLFLCVPRPAISPGIDRVAQSGVTDSISPGSVAQIALDRSPAFRVEFAGRAPAPGACYWRGVTLSRTDGVSWGRGNTAHGTVPLPPPLVERSETVSYEITLQPHNRAWIYTLDCPLTVAQPPGSEAEYQRKFAYEWEARARIGSTRLYRGISDLGAIPADSPSGRHTQLPEEMDPEVAALARELRAASIGVDGRIDAALAIETTLGWFRERGFVYTLEPGDMGPNPTRAFLFDKRRGFCEHYASAFCLLMRLMGVPSRVVVGYYGGETNPIGGFMTVRQANAHAWSEVHIAGLGWRRVDATGAATAVDGQGNPIPQEMQADRSSFQSARGGDGWLGKRLRWAQQRWDYVEAQWDRWALAYDRDSLGALQKLLGLERLGALATPLMLLGGSLPLLALLLLVMRRRRRSADPVVALYAAFCDRLAAAGVARGPAEGPLAFGRRAADALPAESARIIGIAAGYAGLRYGPAEPAPQRQQELRRLRREVRALRTRRPAPRAPQPLRR